MKKIIITSLLFLCWPYAAGAATARVAQTPQNIGVGDTVAVSLSVDAAMPINTFSGTLRYAHNKLELLKVSDGGSVVSLWVTHPRGEDGGILFEGLVPGGYAGNGGLLFTAFFRAKTTGAAVVSLENAVFLRNDGTGSAEDISSKALSITIASKASGGFVERADTNPPEPFIIQPGSGDLFSGSPYIAFTAADKGSGINRYEVAEQRVSFMPLRWQRASSPYVLADNYGTSDTYVKAVDNAGNERISAYTRPNLARPYELLILGILMTVLFIYVKRSI